MSTELNVNVSVDDDDSSDGNGNGDGDDDNDDCNGDDCYIDGNNALVVIMMSPAASNLKTDVHIYIYMDSVTRLEACKKA